MGLRTVLPASAQREGLWLEPQVDLPHLPGAGIEPADQADRQGEARTTGGSRDDQPGVVDATSPDQQEPHCEVRTGDPLSPENK
jgi:hypothetical protein